MISRGTRADGEASASCGGGLVPAGLPGESALPEAAAAAVSGGGASAVAPSPAMESLPDGAAPEGRGSWAEPGSRGSGRSASWGGTRVSRASPQGSGFMTMPGPPPYGVSSTVRCRSWVHSRRSWTWTSRRPARRALPRREMSRTSKYSGKIVMMSSLIGVLPRRARRSGGCGTGPCGAKGPACPARPGPRPERAGGMRGAERRRTCPGHGTGGVGDPVPSPGAGSRGVEQPGGRGDHEPPPGNVHLGGDRRDERDQRLSGGPAYHQEVLAVVQHVGDVADAGAVRGDGGEADQFLVVEVVRVGGRGDVAGVDDEPGAAQAFRGVAVADPGEAREQASRVPAGALDGEGSGGLGVGGDLRARGEAGVRVVRADLDDDLAAHPVCASDPSHHERFAHRDATQRTSLTSRRSTRT